MSRIGEWLGRGGREDDSEALRQRVVEALKQVYDPEIPVNIYDLGLIYGLEIGDDGAIAIDMTLTTPGCPVAETFPGMVEYEVSQVEGARARALVAVIAPAGEKAAIEERTRSGFGGGPCPC